jgi:hypothetical protein
MPITGNGPSVKPFSRPGLLGAVLLHRIELQPETLFQKAFLLQTALQPYLLPPKTFHLKIAGKLLLFKRVTQKFWPDVKRGHMVGGPLR